MQGYPPSWCFAQTVWWFIEPTSSHVLRLYENRKQVAVATAQILYQRFWYVSSMKQYGLGVSPFA